MESGFYWATEGYYNNWTVVEVLGHGGVFMPGSETMYQEEDFIFAAKLDPPKGEDPKELV